MKRVCLPILTIVGPSVTRSLILLEKQVLALDCAELLVGNLVVVLLGLGNEFLMANGVN